jgi:hypothetical protein
VHRIPTYRKPKRSDWTKSLLFIGIYVAAISVAAFILLVTYWYLWIALVAGGMLLFVLWHKKSTAYRWPKCSNEFEVSFLTDFFSPDGVTKNGGGWTYLKCPKCGNRTKMEILVKNLLQTIVFLRVLIREILPTTSLLILMLLRAFPLFQSDNIPNLPTFHSIRSWGYRLLSLLKVSQVLANSS